MSDNTLESSGDRLALVALLKIFFLILLSNLALYLFIVYFAVVNFHRGVPPFLAFIQFLALLLPIALILRMGLKESPAVGQVDNEYLKKIGATPTLVVLSSLTAFFATFTPLAAQIFPKPEPFATSMTAKVGVACRIASDLSAAKGAYFLTVMWSDNSEYIQAARKELRSLQEASLHGPTGQDAVARPIVYRFAEGVIAQALSSIGAITEKASLADDKLYSNIKFVEHSDQFYRLLKQSTFENNDDLRATLGEESRWIAFTSPVGEPYAYTKVPILTQFGTLSHTRVYLIISLENNTPKNVSGNPLDAALAVPLRGTPETKFDIRKISEVEILPHLPERDTQQAELNVVVFPTTSCWQAAPNDTP